VKVVGFDPGGTTGWVAMVADPSHLGTRPVLVASGQFPKWSKVSAIIKPGIDVVVCESFGLFGHKAMSLIGDEMIASQVIGVIKARCEELGIEYVPQIPGEKVFFMDRRLREYGYVPERVTSMHNDRHCMDAIRHVLFYLHFTKKVRVKPYSTEKRG
jgi:hypothetical protein